MQLGGAAWGLEPKALLAVLGALMSTYKGQTQLGQASQPWPLRPGGRGDRKERRAGCTEEGPCLALRLAGEGAGVRGSIPQHWAQLAVEKTGCHGSASLDYSGAAPGSWEGTSLQEEPPWGRCAPEREVKGGGMPHTSCHTGYRVPTGPCLGMARMWRAGPVLGLLSWREQPYGTCKAGCSPKASDGLSCLFRKGLP